MNKNTRSALITLSVLLVLFGVLLELEILLLPTFATLNFWAVVIGFGIMLLVSKK